MKEKRVIKFVAIVALLLALAIPSFADDPTPVSFTLKGSVSAVCSISVSTTTASNLAVTTKVTNSTIANITEKSNASNGYTVTLASANGWMLKGPAANLTYTLSYGGTAVDTTVAAGVTTPITNSSTTTASAGVTKALAISFDGASALLPSGDYTDTLTVAIAAK
jgi:hypothetical protein